MSQSPLPATPLNYSQPPSRGRPGLITAIGVMSIVVGSLSALGSLSGAVSGSMFLLMSRSGLFTPPAPPAPPRQVPATSPATTSTTLPTTANTVTTTVQFQSSSSFVVVGPGGATMTTTTGGGAGGAAAAPAATFVANPFARVNPFAAILSVVASILGLGVAIYLLVIGILTLRDSPSGAKLHWWYVIGKIPLVFFASAAGFWLQSSMMRGVMATMPAAPGGAPMTSPFASPVIMAVSAMMGALFALAYPVALIFVLRTRTVRDFYNTVRE